MVMGNRWNSNHCSELWEMEFRIKSHYSGNGNLWWWSDRNRETVYVTKTHHWEQFLAWESKEHLWNEVKGLEWPLSQLPIYCRIPHKNPVFIKPGMPPRHRWWGEGGPKIIVPEHLKKSVQTLEVYSMYVFMNLLLGGMIPGSSLMAQSLD